MLARIIALCVIVLGVYIGFQQVFGTGDGLSSAGNLISGLLVTLFRVFASLTQFAVNLVSGGSG